MPKMADSTKPGKNQGKRATNDENLSLLSLLAGANASTTSNYDPASLLCKLLQWNSMKYIRMYYKKIFGISYSHVILFI